MKEDEKSRGLGNRPSPDIGFIESLPKVFSTKIIEELHL